MKKGITIFFMVIGFLTFFHIALAKPEDATSTISDVDARFDSLPIGPVQLDMTEEEIASTTTATGTRIHAWLLASGIGLFLLGTIQYKYCFKSE